MNDHWRGPRGRGRKLIRPLRFALIAALLLSLLGLIAPGDAGHLAGRLLVLIVIAAPIARLIFLTQRWWKLGDKRFAGMALLLLAVLAGGTAVSLLR